MRTRPMRWKKCCWRSGRWRRAEAAEITVVNLHLYGLHVGSGGAILPPRWLPPWMQHVHGLAGKLAFSVFTNGIAMDRVDSAAWSRGVGIGTPVVQRSSAGS